MSMPVTAKSAAAADVCTMTFVGPAGLRSVPEGWIASSPDPEEFRAQVGLRRLAGIVFVSLTANAHEARRTVHAVLPERGVGIIHVLQGSVEYERGGDRLRVRTGEIGVMRNDEPYRYRIDSPTRTISTLIPEGEFPAHLLEALGPMPPRTLERTAATQPLADLMEQAMFGDGELSDHARRYLGRAVVDLSVGLIVARRHRSDADDRVADVRLRISEYIDDHLLDPDLGPKRIADELGFSLRYLHQVFSAPGVSVARYIRHSRLDRVAAALDGARTVPTLGTLAARFGFSSGDHLARAFRERFGMTIREFVADTRNGGTKAE